MEPYFIHSLLVCEAKPVMKSIVQSEAAAETLYSELSRDEETSAPTVLQLY